jgi:ribosomal protein S27E
MYPYISTLNAQMKVQDRVPPVDFFQKYKGRSLQKTLSAKIYEAKYDEIISNAAPLDKSIMATLSKSKASFFSAPISSNGNRYVYNNLQLKNIFAFILGSPVYPISNNELVQCNTCGRQLLDPYGHHAVACSTDGELTKTHYRVTHILGEYAEKGGIRVSYEEKCDPNSSLIPGDVVFHNWQGGQDLMIDVTGVHKIQELPIDINSGEPKVFQHIHSREREKNTKYRQHCRDHGYEFRPFVFNTFGLFSGVAMDLIREIAMAWSTKEKLVYSHCVHRIKCHITFTVMASSATAITVRRPQECFSDDGVLQWRRKVRRSRGKRV